MRAYAVTHAGNVRTTNEDAYYLPRPGECFAAVADGMGGHLAGEVASAMAVREFTDCLRGRVIGEETLREAVTAANEAIYLAARRDPLKHGMGTTLTALHIGGGLAYLTHVGDSRAYLFRSGALVQLTVDHSWVKEMVERGELSQREAVSHPRRNLITRALGTNARVEPDIVRLDHQKGDAWLLCSDGLSNELSFAELARALSRGGSWEEKLDALLLNALRHGGGDNITALIALGEEADE